MIWLLAGCLAASLGANWMLWYFYKTSDDLRIESNEYAHKMFGLCNEAELRANRLDDINHDLREELAKESADRTIKESRFLLRSARAKKGWEKRRAA